MTAMVLLSSWMESQVEFWKSVQGFEGYDVSSFGRVRSSRYSQQRFLCIETDQRGYRTVSLYRKGVRKHCKVHRLVLTAFVGEVADKDKVNHLNGYKSDCRLDNLGWVTQSENLIHCHLFLNPSPAKGEKQASAKLSESGVHLIRTLHEQGYSQRFLAKEFGVSHNTIGYVVRRETWTHIT